MKYLLFRPNSGFNDNLNTIYTCLEYCKKYNRVLLLDTFHYFSLYKIEFHKLFTFDEEYKDIVITEKTKIEEILKDQNLSLYPSFLKENILDCSYQTYWNNNSFILTTHTETLAWEWSDGQNFIKYPDGNILPYFSDLDRIYNQQDLDEDIILFPLSGGGSKSHILMNHLTLTDNFIEKIMFRYNKIPKPYTSIHVRNTDMISDYKDFYQENKDMFDNKNIFLATDSSCALDFFMGLGTEHKIFHNTYPLMNNLPYHTYNQDMEQKILNTIIDLFVLALGDEFLRVNKNSGFTTLAHYLYSNKNLLNNVLKIK